MIKKISFMGIIIVMFLACKTINTDAKIWKNKPPYNFIGNELLYTVILDSKKKNT
jgi:lipoprotein